MRADIFFCADSRFALGAWVALWSTWHHWQGEATPHFHLLTSDAEGAGIRKIKALAERQKIPLTVHAVGLDAVKNLPVSRQSALAYLRILVPEILPEIPRFLYLDADILVRSSVHPILEKLSSATILAAAQDFGIYTLGKGIPYFPAADAATVYFNTGIMAINCEAWKKEGMTERVLDFLRQYARELLCADQDGLNGVLQGRIQLLDPRWNVQLGAIEFLDRTGWPEDQMPLQQRRDELLSQARIAHFIGKAKPWNDGFRIPYADEYRQAIFDSGWIDRKWEIPWRAWWLRSAIWRAIMRRFGS